MPRQLIGMILRSAHLFKQKSISRYYRIKEKNEFYKSIIKELPYDRAQKIVPIDNNLKFGSGDEEWNTSNSKSNFS